MTAFSLPPFKDKSLWQQAMTHRSFINEHPEAGEHNERLEFLGDAILTFLSGDYLYGHYPHRPEGELTPIRAALVDQPQLCHFAQVLTRSEEHTSELQSPVPISYAVFCLKKKKKHKPNRTSLNLPNIHYTTRNTKPNEQKETKNRYENTYHSQAQEPVERNL